MEKIRRDGEQVEVRASVDEVRLLVGTLNEALNGGYAFPPAEWEVLVGQPPERAEELLARLLELLES